MRYLYIHVQDPKTPQKEIVWVTDLDDLLQKHGLTYKKLPLPSQMEDLFKKNGHGAIVCARLLGQPHEPIFAVVSMDG